MRLYIDPLASTNAINMEVKTKKVDSATVEIKKKTGVPNYYNIKIQIVENEEDEPNENNWGDLPNNGEIDVPYGKTIYAVLKYETNYGQPHKLTVTNEYIASTVKAKDDINTTGLIRKEDIGLISELFEITWGSEGTGTAVYEITGNLKFNDTEFSKTNLATSSEMQLGNYELGEYEVKCTLIEKSQEGTDIDETMPHATKGVTITTLNTTTVTDKNNQQIDGAKAIYSQYDLAEFRDLVNDETNPQLSINGKIMNDIDMNDVCPETEKGWTPIGKFDISNISFTNMISNTDGTYTNCYTGIFDGDYKEISNLEINNSNSNIALGLFGGVKDGVIKKIIAKDVNINGNRGVGSIVGYSYNTDISNCGNTGTIKAKAFCGGIVGCANKTSNIYSCKNEINISINGDTNNFGGIVGGVCNNSNVRYCYNKGTITTLSSSATVSAQGIGGISGRIDNGGIIEYCYNNGKITASNNNGYIGGIVGDTNQAGSSDKDVYINNCYNLADVKGKIDGTGGVIGNNNNNAKVYLNNAYNKGKIETGKYVGGVVGYSNSITLQGEIFNYGEVSGGSDKTGALIGYAGSIDNKATRRAYGGNCLSTLTTNGTGTNNSYDKDLVMPSVYSIMNEVGDSGDSQYWSKTNVNTPTLLWE